MTENGSTELHHRQRKALETLADGGSIAEAASAAGVTERTVYRYRKDPAFAAALRKANSRALAAMFHDVVRTAGKAITLLESVIEDGKIATGARIRAAQTALRHYSGIYELVELDERLAAIEQRVMEGDNEPAV